MPTSPRHIRLHIRDRALHAYCIRGGRGALNEVCLNRSVYLLSGPVDMAGIEFLLRITNGANRRAGCTHVNPVASMRVHSAFRPDLRSKKIRGPSILSSTLPRLISEEVLFLRNLVSTTYPSKRRTYIPRPHTPSPSKAPSNLQDIRHSCSRTSCKGPGEIFIWSPTQSTHLPSPVGLVSSPTTPTTGLQQTSLQSTMGDKAQRP
jgi:hypothetical protein